MFDFEMEARSVDLRDMSGFQQPREKLTREFVWQLSGQK